jgi:hypothetical protein
VRAVSADRTTVTTPGRDERYARLRRVNLGVGLIHLVQAVVLVLLSNDLALPVFATFLTDDPVVQDGLGEPELIFSIRVGFAVALFVAFAAADHLLVAGPLRRWYEGRLDARANTARWIEYSVSSSIMVVVIAQLTGIWDLAALGAIFAVNSSMILFGLVMERREEPETADWTAFWAGSAVGVVPWLLLGYYIGANAGDVPTFVFVIYVVQTAPSTSSTSIPVRSWSMISGIEPRAKAITGVPHAMRLHHAEAERLVEVDEVEQRMGPAEHAAAVVPRRPVRDSAPGRRRGAARPRRGSRPRPGRCRRCRDGARLIRCATSMACAVPLSGWMRPKYSRWSPGSGPSGTRRCRCRGGWWRRSAAPGGGRRR